MRVSKHHMTRIDVDARYLPRTAGDTCPSFETIYLHLVGEDGTDVVELFCPERLSNFGEAAQGVKVLESLIGSAQVALAALEQAIEANEINEAALDYIGRDL